MKLNKVRTVLIASALSFVGGVSPAAAAERLHVTVPFSFTVGDTKMAAGVYNITESENGLVTIAGSKTSAIFLTVPGDNKDRSALSFESNPSHTLTAIDVSGAQSREVPVHGSDRKVSFVRAR